MHSQPDHTEPSSSKQPQPLKLLAEPVTEFLVLLRSQDGRHIKLILALTIEPDGGLLDFFLFHSTRVSDYLLA